MQKTSIIMRGYFYCVKTLGNIMHYNKKLLWLLLVVCNITKGTNVNYGVEIGIVIDKKDNKIINNGEYCALQKISLQANDSFQGNGNIYAESVVIHTKKFEFAGTITCFNQCIINVQEPFDKTIFKQEGPGEFIINVGEDYYNRPVTLQKESSMSLEPLKKLVVQFPKNHPVKTMGAVVGLSVALGIALFHKK